MKLIQMIRLLKISLSFVQGSFLSFLSLNFLSSFFLPSSSSQFSHGTFSTLRVLDLIVCVCVCEVK